MRIERSADDDVVDTRIGVRMENFRDDTGFRTGSNDTMTPDAREAKRLRNQLVEYDGYLQEMRKVNQKNVDTLDVIQRYTEKSASGIQKLTQDSADGMQRLAEESLQGVKKLAGECAGSMRKYAEDGSNGLRDMAENGTSGIAKVSSAAEEGLTALAGQSMEQLHALYEKCMEQIKELTDISLSKIEEVNSRSVEAARSVEEIKEIVEQQAQAMQELQKQADDFNHKENVKVYRNVQAVVVEEVGKQTEELKGENKKFKPLIIGTLAAAVINIILMIMQILVF